ncbi:MAG: DnaA regulatory inactivator Hda [Gammaproteobacteria bacterium]
MNNSGNQLPLTFGQTETFFFDQFLNGANTEAVQKIRSIVEDESLKESIFIWGAKGVGKSHLLQALCKALAETDQQSVYLPLSQKQKFTPLFLEGLEELPIICLDDVDQIMGDLEWEKAIFHLYNRVKELDHILVMSANSAPKTIEFELADLASRMNWGLIYQLQDLDDAEKLIVLQKRADQKSFALPDDVGEFLIKRLPRDMHALCDFLDKLDHASLAAKRKLTVPFVKELLNKGG